MSSRLPFFAVCLLSPAAEAAGADFKKDIAPIFKAKCYECHSEAAKKEKAGYVFDNVERLKGDIRPYGQIVPGEPDESPLLELVTLPEGAKRRMPPDGPGLTPREIKLMREWIAAGASLDKKGVADKPSGLAAKPALRPVQKWSSAEDVMIEASFVALEGDTVHLLKGGKPYKVPLSRLSADSQALAKTEAAAAARAAVKPK